MQDYTTLEYVLPEANQSVEPAKPIFLMLVDTAVPSEELVELKDSLQ